jgi:hypothetical protein
MSGRVRGVMSQEFQTVPNEHRESPYRELALTE